MPDLIPTAPSLGLPPGPGEPPIVVADDAALHFLNSLATPANEPVDWLANGKALLSWLRATGLAGASDLAAAEGLPASALDHLAGQARWLREWSRNAIGCWSAGGTPNPELLAPLNDALRLDRTWRMLVADDANVIWNEKRDQAEPQWMLARLATSVGDLLVRGDRDRVRRCEGARCTLWFFDASRANRRRWCSMAICGNRAKVNAYRKRARL
jgi:predicted RNA-binding Zn ribbon-like protein